MPRLRIPAVLLLALASSPATAQPSEGALLPYPGVVVEAASGDRVPFARVTLTGRADGRERYYWAEADGRGEFELQAEPGTYHLQLMASYVTTGADSVRLSSRGGDTLRVAFPGRTLPNELAQRRRMAAGALSPCGTPWTPTRVDSFRAVLAAALADDEPADSLLARAAAAPDLRPVDAAGCAPVLAALHPITRTQVLHGRARFEALRAGPYLLVLEEPTPPIGGVWVTSGRFYLLDARSLETVDTGYLRQRRANPGDLIH